MKREVRQLYTRFNSLNYDWKNLLNKKCPKYLALWPARFRGGEKPSLSQKIQADKLRRSWNSLNRERRRLSHIVEYLIDDGTDHLNVEPDLLLVEVKSLYEAYIKALKDRNSTVTEFSALLKDCKKDTKRNLHQVKRDTNQDSK